MMGRLFLFRGHEDAFNISQMRDIVITECLHGNVVYDLQPNIGIFERWYSTYWTEWNKWK